MKKEELIEDYLVYTDEGIERVHWCNVNGVKELVSPKGKVYGYVPDYFEVKRLQKQLKEANKAIKQYAWDSGYWECGYHYKDSFFANIYLKKWGVK